MSCYISALLEAVILHAVAGTIMRDGRPLETIMDAADCERIAKSVLTGLAAYEAQEKKNG